jgi:hypothetical protein
MKRDRIRLFRKSLKCMRGAPLTDEQLDALARAHGSRLIRQPAAPVEQLERNASPKGKMS